MLKPIIYLSCAFFLLTGSFPTTHAAELTKSPLTQSEMDSIAQEDTGSFDEITAGVMDKQTSTVMIGVSIVVLIVLAVAMAAP